MHEWVITDCMEPTDEDEPLPRIPVHSEAALRAALAAFRLRDPGILFLKNGGPDSLLIGIGGPFSTVTVWRPPGDDRVIRH